MCKPSISLSESSPDGPDLARPSGSGLGLFIEIKLHHDTEDGMARWLAAQLEGRLCSSGAQEPERAPPSHQLTTHNRIKYLCLHLEEP